MRAETPSKFALLCSCFLRSYNCPLRGSPADVIWTEDKYSKCWKCRALNKLSRTTHSDRNSVSCGNFFGYDTACSITISTCDSESQLFLSITSRFCILVVAVYLPIPCSQKPLVVHFPYHASQGLTFSNFASVSASSSSCLLILSLSAAKSFPT